MCVTIARGLPRCHGPITRPFSNSFFLSSVSALQDTCLEESEPARPKLAQPAQTEGLVFYNLWLNTSRFLLVRV